MRIEAVQGRERVANPGDVSVSRSESAPTDSALIVAPMFRVRVVKDHTLFVGIKDMIPEDIIWRREHPNVPAMICLQENQACGCTWDCMTKLATRSFFFFRQFPRAVQLFMLFQRTQETALQRNAVRVQDLYAAERGMKVQERRTTLPRLQAVHVTSDFKIIRVLRVNYDGLQYLLKDAEIREVKQPRVW